MVECAIYYTALIEDRRSRGKKHLARFPREAIYLKVKQLLEDHAYASLINGIKVTSFVPDYWWCKRWEEEYGLTFKKANRKYAVPWWVQLFILQVFGYDPVLVNFDQSPFHNNERGSQFPISRSSKLRIRSRGIRNRFTS